MEQYPRFSGAQTALSVRADPPRVLARFSVASTASIVTADFHRKLLKTTLPVRQTARSTWFSSPSAMPASSRCVGVRSLGIAGGVLRTCLTLPRSALGTRQVNSASDGQIPTTYPTVEYVRRCLSPTSLPLVRTSRSGKSCSRLSHKWMLETNQRSSPSATCCHKTMCTRILLVQFGTLYRTSQILVQPCAISPAGQHQSYLSSTQE